MADQVTLKNQIDIMAMAILVVLSASWGLQQVAIKIAYQGVPPILQAGIRSVGATILLWIWMSAQRQPIFERDGTLWWGIAAGLLFTAEFIMIYWGLEFTSASRAAIFINTAPFIVALGAQFFIPGEQLRLVQIVGLCSAFAGIVVAFSESATDANLRILIGDGMIVVAAIFWGATTVLIKAGPLSNIQPGKTLLYQLAVSAVVLPLVTLVKGETHILRMTPIIAASLVYQTVWVAFITFLAWFWLMRNYPASRLVSFNFLTPIFGVIAGGVILNEPISGMLLLTLVLVGTGIYLVNRPVPGRNIR
ncbi:MAG: DMT family transporter [Desulfobacterales bacterium]|jgi:drug/metabolite transporter (DMT)-like permease